MRNVFDQYEQPENRLTHALFTTLDRHRAYLRPFLSYLGVPDIPPVKTLRITEQQVPGTQVSDDDEAESRGLPDACVFTDDGWAVLFESKVQAQIKAGQLHRHRKTAIRHGFETPFMVVISVDTAPSSLPDDTITITWREVYRWFSKRSHEPWARELVQYMQTFERKMLAKDYEIRGTITVFDGLRFDRDNPYTYREGKRLIRLLGDQLQARKDLHAIGVDPEGKRRVAITGRGEDQIWDFIPLDVAQEAQQFTAYPHLTMVLNRSRAVAAVTVPNGVKGGFRTKLANLGLDGFMELMAGLDNGLRPILKRSPGAKALIYATQRHYKSQRSNAEVDARLDADLRTAVPDADGRVKYQPQWLSAIYDVLINKRSNVQTGIEVRFNYKCKLLRSQKAVDLFADSWKAMSPLISFVLQDDAE